MSLEVKSINGSNLETVFFALCHLFFQPVAYSGACCDSLSLGLHQQSSICINIISVNRRSAPSIQPLNRLFPRKSVSLSSPIVTPISQYFVFFQPVQDNCSFVGEDTKRQIDQL